VGPGIAGGKKEKGGAALYKKAVKCGRRRRTSCVEFTKRTLKRGWGGGALLKTPGEGAKKGNVERRKSLKRDFKKEGLRIIGRKKEGKVHEWGESISSRGRPLRNPELNSQRSQSMDTTDRRTEYWKKKKK